MGFAFLGYTMLAVLLTWPLVLHLTTHVPHDIEDPLLSASILWWNAHVLPLTSRWLDGFFFPGGGALAFSDHRLGLMVIAAPLQWLGFGPIATYNLTLLLTFPLCAVAAHALAFELTGRHDASIVAGLGFGFSPFRMEHISHLELLAAFGMPIALLAMHRLRTTGRRSWIGVLAATLVVQGLSASYYLLFFSVLIALWVAWFVRWREWRDGLAVAAGCAIAATVLAPVAVEFLRVHARFGLSRPFGEILMYSADATSIVTGSRMLALWGWTSELNINEGRNFLGFTLVVLAACGLVSSRRRDQSPAGGAAIRRALLAMGAIFGTIAAITAWRGPWRSSWGPLVISATVASKPLSVALVCFVAVGLLSARFRSALVRRSPFAFYLTAAIVLVLCSMGPQPKFLGHPFLYQPPYAWLMHLPLFDTGVRVPARFAMVAALALSTAAALAFAKVTTAGSSTARTVGALAWTGIMLDTFVGAMPMAAVPSRWDVAQARDARAVLELPLGGTSEDVTAMFRSIGPHGHGRPTVNGYSGYAPTHYLVLRAAIADHDDSALSAIAAAAGPLLVAASERGDHEWPAFVDAHAGSRLLGKDDERRFYAIEQAPVPAPACEAGPLPIAAASDGTSIIALAPLVDRNAMTWWTPGHPQRPGDTLVLDLGHAARPCALILSQTGFAMLYPRAVEVTLSTDGQSWTRAFSGRTGGLMVTSALAHEADPPLPIPLPGTPARFIKVTLTAPVDKDGWVVTDVAVRGETAQ